MVHYWNRETSAKQSYNVSAPITKEARIISISLDDDNNAFLHQNPGLQSNLMKIYKTGTIEEINLDELNQIRPNVIFVSHPNAREPLAYILKNVPSIEWIHARSAGLDFITSETLASYTNKLTNAKGHFSSTLAEYTMMACSYFAKDLPRLLKQKTEKFWGKYNVEEIRGKTMGIIGYGDIGRACARLAHAYGMNIIALRRNPSSAQGISDPFISTIYSSKDKSNLHHVMEKSDYILIAAPLTHETRGMIDAEALSHAQSHAVLINVGRGPIIDESALIDALREQKLRGAALDVFEIEPLPPQSKMWDLENVLISPHNMDQTATFMKEATEFFVQENLPRFIRNLELLNPCDSKLGY